MSSNNEHFRDEFASKIATVLPPEQLKNVLQAFDITSNGYDIQRKALEIIPAGGVPEVVKYYLASKAVENLSKGTLKQYRYKLIDFFETVNKSIQAINTNDVRLYLYNIKQTRNVSDRYIECIRVTLNCFFKWLVANDYLLRNPCEKIERIKFQEKKREPLTSYELEVFRWNSQNIREKALIDFLFSTGCRVSECADVRLSDIDWTNRAVTIRHGKGGKERIVYFNAESELTMRKYIDSRSDDTDALFVSAKKPHQQLGPHALENILKKVSDRAGMHVFPHKLRHTFATSGLRGGITLEKLQMLMGHTRPETTLIYAKLNQTDIRMEHQRVYA